MDRTDGKLERNPEISIIIAVYNGWSMLNHCLRSLAAQTGPSFECIVVDDGSAEPVPETILHWGGRFALTVLRRDHAGISAARNAGIRASRGTLLLFTDADCEVQPGCLGELASAIQASTQDDFFQLRLIGQTHTETGRAEDLRLAAIQEQTLQPDGHIRYLNAAGFAARRSAVDMEAGLFSPVALRGEDTFLLVNLIQRHQLPRFVSQAIIRHCVPASLLVCLRKDLRSAYLQSRTYTLISKTGVKIRMSNRARLKMLRCMWRVAGSKSIPKTAFFVLIARQVLERTVSMVCQTAKIYPRIQNVSDAT
jgi:glycosyltransferase involved in cell wall biosynthesis